jgi:hypothetical protein
MKSITDKRLSELTERLESLQQRQAEQQRAVVALEQEFQQAAEHDLNEAAAYVHGGEKGKKPKARAPEVEHALAAARHDLEVTSRAVTMASGALSRYQSENAERLWGQVLEAKAALAREVAERAEPMRDLLRRFQLPDEDARVLRPYLERPAQENTGKPQDVVTFGTPLRTNNVFGQDRVGGMTIGQIEALMVELAGLAERYAHDRGGDRSGAVVVGPSEDEGAA